MAKVAFPGSFSSNSLPYERGASKVQGGATMKRKTPSELRDEQLKRRACPAKVDEPSASSSCSEKNNGGIVSNKKPDTSKIPRYIDTRVDDVYPARKPSNRLILLNRKENVKNVPANEQGVNMKNSSINSIVDSKSQPELTSSDTTPVLNASDKDGSAQTGSITRKCSQNTIHKVSNVSLGIEKSSGSKITKAITNMEALKTLGVREPLSVSHPHNESSARSGDLPSFSPGSLSMELSIPGRKIPLDFTLKTTMKLISSYSVKWCHRLINSSKFNGMTHSTSPVGCFENQNTLLLEDNSAAVALFSQSLHSWRYPQSSLPPSIISALTVSSAQGDMDFLLKRQLGWQDSFRNLYYMLRNNMCNIFYVCTPQFVVLFIGSDCTGKKKRTCNAYVSQSTRGLRSLLREHDISFSMPLCDSEAELASAEDMVELSEIENNSLGQARRLGSMLDVKDNSPQSLLAFSGNAIVHGLYDFLLNYRSFLSSLVGMDVPTLCAPILFRNASISVPEVKCKEMKMTNSLASLSRGPHLEDSESTKDSSAGVCYSIEIKDVILPPWVICGICASMGSEGRSFEASFTTEPASLGLNVALDTVFPKSDTERDTSKGLQENSLIFGIPEAVTSRSLRSAALRGLKYSDRSYTACLLPV
ncbi:downstream neighbor of Son [Thalictrum thalictroides]|uniref:Downstream neighbor of Son n=1 Tax=Thalictrum thalictroides TaxID=46969 RepID=A0A7J6WKH1_THATH|nr:downstream neighbor of Son [Thalictrum thalictroides]